MPSLTLQGVTVDFPFPPYECQKKYMEKVLQCLQKKQNGVLESPTGTGKTLCLLCATLAWRDGFRDSISARKITQRLEGEELFPKTPLSTWATAATDGDNPTTFYTDMPKIIYASRTHAQLVQVINELKNTSYRPKVCVLGSREQLCINPEVMRQESHHVKVHMCRSKVSTRSCFYYNNVEEKSTDRDVTNAILDVEDLVKFGNKQKVCPYYLSMNLKQQAEVIFMPYNYLLDPKSRRAQNIELSGAVVIFDEAHNVEKTCEESTSFDLTPYDVASAVSALDRLLEEQLKETVSEDFNVENMGSELKISVASIAKVKKVLLDLEAVIDSYEVHSDRGFTKPGIFIYELLQRAQLTYSNKALLSDALEQIIGHLAGQRGIFHNTSGLQKLNDIIQLVFCGDPSEKDQKNQMESNTTFFKVHIHKDNSFQKKSHSTDPWASSSSSSKKQGNILSYWCFSPGFSMKELKDQGVRCIILTSGTLSPLSSFTSEMKISFPVLLENSHVIERDQIFVSIMDRGPDGVSLSSAFDRRFVPENMSSLGNTVANLSRVVPDGLLVFFPSFPVMEKTLDFWKANGHADRIESVKPMFVEPKGKGTFTEVIDGYYNKVDDPASKGGSFFAVCRGKASEGLDFADTFGRGVIITGLPFPPKLDPRVVLKMQFLDEMRQKKKPGQTYLSGNEWYRQQAFRAVNQAIGRVIRHKEDFGAIFLCDQRFKNADVRANLPSWIRPYVRFCDSFGNVVRDVSQFFRVAHKMRPVVKKKGAAAESCGTVRSADSHASCSTSSSASSSESKASQKAKMIDPHLPSLKRRKLDANGGGGGLARVCVQYECEAVESRRRPANLLDALDRGEHQGGDAGQATAGEEQASRLSTLSLQFEKRMEDELRGGKRKIKLVQEQMSGVCVEGGSEEGKASRAKTFLCEMKSSLSHVTFEAVIQALQRYKKTDDLEGLLTDTAVLTENANTHGLLRGFFQFVRPHHKKMFDERCQELTGHGCGYQPHHSLSKEQRKAVLLHTDGAAAVGAKSTCSQLSTQQLNQGGDHLSQQGLQQRQAGCAPKNAVHSSFLADVKKSLSAEETSLLFKAIHSYKQTDQYKALVPTVVSLFTQRDATFSLLDRFSMFIRPHHQNQYREMLDGLTGRASSAEQHLPVDAGASQSSSSLKTQSKIHSFFCNSPRK